MLSKLTYVVLNSEFLKTEYTLHYSKICTHWRKWHRQLKSVLTGYFTYPVGEDGVGEGGIWWKMDGGWGGGGGVWILGRGTRKYKKKGGREEKWAGAGRLNPRGSPISPRYPMLSTWRCKEAGYQQLRCWHDSLGISQFQQQNYSR